MRADIFCRVIDNFGDIGVAWRLARQLATEHNWSIRLWVDDVQSFAKLEPNVLSQQSIKGVDIVHWTHATNLTPADVAIAMFSCDLPDAYIEQIKLKDKPVLWLNLEYLSAEDWVETCHALQSLRSDGLSSYFFFPGFTTKTGGLIRESTLLSSRDTWINNHESQHAFLKSLGISPEALSIWHKSHIPQANSSQNTIKLISLFCYPNAPIEQLIAQLEKADTASILLIPEGIAPQLYAGKQGKVYIERIPFVPQTEYDKILWTCDLNFVRGEDSIVRAIWSSKPFIWQIYSQSENTHLLKLDAWLARSTLPESVGQLMRSWNPPSVDVSPDSSMATKTNFTQSFSQNITAANFEIWKKSTQTFTQKLSLQPDLSTSIDQFVRNKLPS